MRDLTNKTKIAEINNYLVNLQTNDIIRVVDIYTNIVFNTKKNVLKLENGQTMINTAEGVSIMKFKLWVPENRDYVIINNSISLKEFKAKSVKSFDDNKREITLTDNSKIKLNEVQPFKGNLDI